MNIRSALSGVSPAVRGPASRESALTDQAVEAAPSAPLNGLVDGLMDVGFFAFNELVEVGKNDPALALRYGATSMSDQLLQGVGENVRQGFNAAIIPTIRMSILAANSYRAKRTFTDSSSHLAEKAFDAARVATDVIGLAGSVMKYAFPERAALGDTLVGISYAADAVSHSVRGMTHGASRAVTWKKMLEARKESSRKKELPAAPVVTAPIAQMPIAPRSSALQ